ncbi:helix-turn-helix domain-containing protein [Tenacibaculum sp. SZ-18]|uniref:helix-turn-helix domain-containing protein n=1 Tax=Tenacibaculum sp. SZ-18 TaxID=754423 RepID=UPI0012FE04D2|nr:helix-turn-helix domain-containing protein [Tenacibaculum sp. SZ-18]
MSLLNRLFWIFKNSGEYEKAYEQLILTSKFIEQIRNDYFDSFYYVINNELSKAQIKYELQLVEESKTILNKLVHTIEAKKLNSQDFFQHKALYRKKADIYNSLGKVWIAISKKNNQLQLLDSASFYYKKAYQAALKFSPPHPDSKFIYQLRQLDVLIAKKQFSKSLEIISQIDYPKNTIKTDYSGEISFYKTICYNHLNNPDSSVYHAKNVLSKTKLPSNRIIKIYDILSNQYLTQNKTDSAYKYSQLTIKEFNLAKEHEQKTYQLLYDNDIQKINQLNDTIIESEKRKNTKVVVSIVLIAMLISVYFIFKRKKYKNEIIEKTSEIEKSQIKTTITKQKVNYNIEDELEDKILDLIKKAENNLDYLIEDFSINTIAELAQTNSTYVSFTFNKHFDMPFKRYFTKKKIEHALDLMNNHHIYEKYSIEGLANQVGYKSASAFSRAFKKEMNISPSKFIKNLRQ